MAKTLQIEGTAAPDEVRDNWQTAFSLKTKLIQKDVYAFEAELRLLEKTAPTLETLVSQAMQIMRMVGMTLGTSIEAEHHLKAAMKAGWITTPICEVAEISLNGTGKHETRFLFDGENLDTMHPGKVRWYGRQIQMAFNAAVAIPDPNL